MTQKKKRFIIISAILISIILIIGGITWYLNRQISPIVLSEKEKTQLTTRIENSQKPSSPSYQAGDKTLSLSEREINGLFHSNTNLGDQIRFELAQDAIHARVQYQLDQDFPVFPGKKIKAKTRLLIQEISKDSPTPSIILDDITLWGISLPNAWLGDLKDINLFESFSGNLQGNAFSRGIESLKITPGALEITFAE